MEASGAVVARKTRGNHSDKIAKSGEDWPPAERAARERAARAPRSPVDLASDVEGRCN
jgi:hypothetical protein